MQSNISQENTEQPELLEMESPMKTNKRSKDVSVKGVSNAMTELLSINVRGFLNSDQRHHKS